MDVLLLAGPKGSYMFTFLRLADGLDLWDRKPFALLHLLLDALKLVYLLVNDLEELDYSVVAAEEGGLLGSLIDPLQGSDRLVDL